MLTYDGKRHASYDISPTSAEEVGDITAIFIKSGMLPIDIGSQDFSYPNKLVPRRYNSLAYSVQTPCPQ
jgi:hypothetical protein